MSQIQTLNKKLIAEKEELTNKNIRLDRQLNEAYEKLDNLEKKYSKIFPIAEKAERIQKRFEETQERARRLDRQLNKITKIKSQQDSEIAKYRVKEQTFKKILEQYFPKMLDIFITKFPSVNTVLRQPPFLQLKQSMSLIELKKQCEQVQDEIQLRKGNLEKILRYGQKLIKQCHEKVRQQKEQLHIETIPEDKRQMERCIGFFEKCQKTIKENKEKYEKGFKPPQIPSQEQQKQSQLQILLQQRNQLLSAIKKDKQA